MRVAFRRVRAGDLKRLNGIVNDPGVSRYLTLIPPVSMKDSRRFLGEVKRNRWRWYCVLVDGEVAGGVSLMPKRKNTKQSHVADVGIDLAREYWGRGLGLKAFRFVVREARAAGVRRLELQVVRENKRARRLYEKAGFREEGVKRKAFKIGGRYHDTVMMARLL